MHCVIDNKISSLIIKYAALLITLIIIDNKIHCSIDNNDDY